MTVKNYPYEYIVVTDGDEVTNSENLFNNNGRVLGNVEEPLKSNDGGENNNKRKEEDMGIPCQILDEDGKTLANLPEIVYNMFEREYGIKVEYNSDNMLLYYVSDTQTNLPVSQIANRMLIKELKQRNNRNRIVFGVENLIVRPQNIPSGPAVTTGLISWFDLSFFDNLFNFKKGFFYQNFSDESAKRTTNFAKVFEHDFLFHNVKEIDNSKQENIRQKKYVGAYKPGKVEELVNQIREQINLNDYLALNYQLVKGGKSVKYFGTKEQMHAIKSPDDLETNSNAQLVSA